MPGTSKITISLPDRLLEEADAKLTRDGESRSAMLRRLIEDALTEIQEREEVQRYLRAYREQPQTEEESGWHDAVNAEMARHLPWQE